MSNPCDYGMCDPSRCTDKDCVGEVERNKNIVKEREEEESVQQEDNLHR